MHQLDPKAFLLGHSWNLSSTFELDPRRDGEDYLIGAWQPAVDRSRFGFYGFFNAIPAMRTPLIQRLLDLVSHFRRDRSLQRQDERAKRFSTLAISFLGLIMVTSGCLSPKLERRETIRYGQRKGYDLTYELMQPKRSNGLGVVVMVSGSWKIQP